MLRTCLIFLLLGLPLCAKFSPTPNNFNGEVLKNSKWPSRYTVPGNANGYGNSKPLTLYPESPGLFGNTYKNYNTGYGILKSPQPYSKTPGYISKSAGPMHYRPPPTYVNLVNKYRDSNSKYRELITGLGWYNLDRISRSHDPTRMYITKPGEICKIGVKKDTEYEEVRIDCELMSSFTKVSVAFSGTPIITTDIGRHALEVKGSPVIVTPGMECFVIRMLEASVAKQLEECYLLQEYSSKVVTVVSNSSDRVRFVCVAYLIMTIMSVFTLNIFYDN